MHEDDFDHVEGYERSNAFKEKVERTIQGERGQEVAKMCPDWCNEMSRENKGQLSGIKGAPNISRPSNIFIRKKQSLNSNDVILPRQRSLGYRVVLPIIK